MRTRYVVEGWGEGELWTGGGLVLAHDFHFALAEVASGRAAGTARSADAAVGPAPPVGGANRPSGTVAPGRAQGSDAFVTTARQRGGGRQGVADGSALDDGARDPVALAAHLSAFLAGEDVRLDQVPLELGSCTPFQRDVVSALRAVPRGEVVTYGELAAIAGYPRAGRAVGTVCATNHFMLFVPCHRVVASAGIGGYGSAGVGVKLRLLALEGVSL